VTLVCGGVLGPYLSEAGRKSVVKRMRQLGVTVVDGPGAKVTEVHKTRCCSPTAASCQAS